jgi:hypothetical protein
MVAEGVANVLENPRTDEVATKASIRGPLGNPNADTGEIIVGLIQNAFFEAILPGLDRDIEDSGIWSAANRKQALEEGTRDDDARGP